MFLAKNIWLFRGCSRFREAFGVQNSCFALLWLFKAKQEFRTPYASRSVVRGDLSPTPNFKRLIIALLKEALLLQEHAGKHHRIRFFLLSILKPVQWLARRFRDHA